MRLGGADLSQATECSGPLDAGLRQTGLIAERLELVRRVLCLFRCSLQPVGVGHHGELGGEAGRPGLQPWITQRPLAQTLHEIGAGGRVARRQHRFTGEHQQLGQRGVVVGQTADCAASEPGSR